MEQDESFMDTIKTVVYAVVIAILIRTFLFEPFMATGDTTYS